MVDWLFGAPRVPPWSSAADADPARQTGLWHINAPNNVTAPARPRAGIIPPTQMKDDPMEPHTAPPPLRWRPMPLRWRYSSGAWLFAVLLFACVAPSGDGVKPDAWVATWRTAPQLTEPRNMPPEPHLIGNTLRQALRISIGGQRLQVHFSNEYGATEMAIRAAHVARYAGSGAIDPDSDRPLSFQGQPGLYLEPGETATSDPLDLTVEPLADLALTLWFGDVPDGLTGHPGSRTTSYIAPGNAVSRPSLADGVRTDHWYVITGIDVAAPGASAVAILGNSITDGRGSTTNANDRWPDLLSRRLQADSSTANVAVLNQGIGGNCVLRACLGPSGIDRFARDILDPPGVRWAIVFEGVNDIGGASGAAQSDSVARALITSYQELMALAHARGARVYGATLLPFGGSFYWSPVHETARQTVNRWIRRSGAFDAVIDFDMALRDPADSTRLRPEADTGDHLHPNARGYHLMAEAVDLTLFR